MNINQNVEKLLKTQDIVTLGFSTGKDSLACALVLQELGVKFIPFFFYHVPELEFVERNIEKYEKALKIEVIRMPHPMLYDYLRHQDFMGPNMIQFLHKKGIPKVSFEMMIDTYLQSIGIMEIKYDVVGQRAAESFNRRMLFKKQGFFNHDAKKVFPICDWKKDDVLEFIKSKGHTLTPDYEIWNRSFDGLKYQFLFGVQKHYPQDYARIKEMFPLIDLELFRYEQNKTYFEKV